MPESTAPTDAPIGRVVATQRNPTTTGQVHFWLRTGVNLKPFDFVRLTTSTMGSRSDRDTRDVGDFYAMVTEIKQVSDEDSPLSGFISADFGKSDMTPRVERVVTTFAEATVIFNTEGLEMPVPHNSEVHWPEEAGVRKALGIDDYQRCVPAGYITMSAPKVPTIHVDLDADYLIGPEGAHLNISGISGLATKTSYAMFLLTGIQQQQEADWDGEKAAFVILNVKGSDLLEVDQPNPELKDEDLRGWEKCGLEAKPLQNVTYFYPYSSDASKGNVQTKLPKSLVTRNVEAGKAFRYYYDVKGVIPRLRLLVEDIEDKNQTSASCAEQLSQHPWGDAPTWNQFREELRTRTRAGGTRNQEISVMSWRRFARLVGQRTRSSPIFAERDTPDRVEATKQVGLREILNHLKPGHVVVIDIAQLPDYVQSFVVGDTIDLIRSAKTGHSEVAADGDTSDEDDEDSPEPQVGPVILFADELNKFAPEHGQDRSLTRYLREISERGRSEGITLFGAEQFRTAIDKRVTGNSSSQVFGRTTAVEADRDREIKGLPQAKRVPFLRKGELLVSHTRFSSGTLKLKFPLNAYKPG